MKKSLYEIDDVVLVRDKGELTLGRVIDVLFRKERKRQKQDGMNGKATGEVIIVPVYLVQLSELFGSEYLFDELEIIPIKVNINI